MPSGKKQRILRAEVTRVAFVPRGANRLSALYKEDGGLEFAPLSKFDQEKGELLTIVYLPERGDAEGHQADAGVIAKMAHSHARNGLALDVRHGANALTKEQAFVAESFIIQKDDPRFTGWKDDDGKPIDATNGWGQLIKIDDPAIRKLYGTEGWEGVSLYSPPGKFELAPLEKSADVADRIVEAFEKALTGRNKETDVDEATLVKALAANNTALVEALAKALKPDPAAPAPAAPPAKKSDEEKPLTFEGDPTNVDDVRAHGRKVRLASLAKEVNWSDAASVEKHALAVADLAKEDSLSKKPEVREKEAEIAKLQKELKDLRKASAQPIANGNDAPASSGNGSSGLSKEQVDLAASGAAAARALNEQRGFKKVA